MKTRLIFTLAACAAAAALAQEPPAEEQRMAQALNMPELPPLPAFGELAPERVVKGAPYCADAVHETVQWLPDANGGAPNRIVRQQTTRLCRDGEGRTRQESERNGRKWVYLRDPVAGETWQLDPAARTARSVRGIARMGDAFFDSEAWRVYGERLREWGRNFGQRFSLDRTAPMPPVPPIPPTPPVPAGKVGNEKPIVIVREVWTAPELMLTLRSRDFDPRSNEVNYRLQNLGRGEPDAALMRVPADYNVRKPAPRASSATG